MIPSASEIIEHLTKDLPESKIEPVTKAEELADLLEKNAEGPQEPEITPDMKQMAKIALAQEIINGKVDLYNKWHELFDNFDAIPEDIIEDEKIAAMSVSFNGIDKILEPEIEYKKCAEIIFDSLTENDGRLGLHIKQVFDY